MQLSAKGQYAVIAMLDLAQQEYGRPMTLSEMTLARSISLSYLEQLFAKLRRSGLVEGVRGPGGGYRLTKMPHKISIAEIFLAIEGNTQPARVQDSLEGMSLELALWSDLSGRLCHFLESITLDELVPKADFKSVVSEQSDESRRMNYLQPPPAELA